MRGELAPVLAAGFMPPIVDGFERFLQAEAVVDQVTKAVAKEMADGRVEPYDSHPPLRERVQEIEALALAPVEEDVRPAAALVGDLAALEDRLAPFIVADRESMHQRIGWDEVGAKVYAPHWRRTVRGLANMDIATLPIDRAYLRVLMRSVGHPVGAAGDAELYRWAIEAYGAYLAVALIEKGYQVSVAPGAEVTLEHDGDRG